MEASLDRGQGLYPLVEVVAAAKRLLSKMGFRSLFNFVRPSVHWSRLFATTFRPIVPTAVRLIPCLGGGGVCRTRLPGSQMFLGHNSTGGKRAVRETFPLSPLGRPVARPVSWRGKVSVHWEII